MSRTSRPSSCCPGEKVGDYVGTVAVTDERTVLSKALDEGANSCSRCRPWRPTRPGMQSGSLQSYQGILAQMGEVQSMLTSVRDGLGVATAAETRARLHRSPTQIDGISGDLQYLAGTMARVKLVEGRVGTVLDRVGYLPVLLRGTAAQDGLPQGAGRTRPGLHRGRPGIDRASAKTCAERPGRWMTSSTGSTRSSRSCWAGGNARMSWPTQLDYFGGALEPGSKGPQDPRQPAQRHRFDPEPAARVSTP